MLFPLSRIPIPAIYLVLAGFPIMPALWGTFRGFPREYLTPAHVCLLSRILFGYPCLPAICPALRGPRKRSWRFGVHFAIPIARNPRLFVYCPECHSGLLSTLLRDSPPPPPFFFLGRSPIYQLQRA